MKIELHIDGEPKAFAGHRSRRGRKKRFAPTPQQRFMANVENIARGVMLDKKILRGPVYVVITAVYEYPKTWSALKKKETFWKTSRPDIDNICKIIKDSLNKIVYFDDAQVTRLEACKWYGLSSYVRVEVTPIVEDTICPNKR